MGADYRAVRAQLDTAHRLASIRLGAMEIYKAGLADAFPHEMDDDEVWEMIRSMPAAHIVPLIQALQWALAGLAMEMDDGARILEHAIELIRSSLDKIIDELPK